MSDSLSNLSLFKRSNGLYYVLFVDGGRRRWKSTGCTVKADALKVLTNFKQLFKEKPKHLSLEQFEKEFLEYAKTAHARPTVDIFTIALRHLRAIAGDCLLSAITPQHIDLYKAKRLKDEVSLVTINVELRALRTMLNVALRWQRLETSPFAKLQQLGVPERKPTFLSRNGFQALLKSINEEWLRELVVFAVLTGMRRGEILNLRWQNIDLARKVIFIETDASFKTKAGKRRVVPMNEAVFALLGRKAMTEKAIGNADNEYVFTYKGKQINGSYLTHEFKEYARKIDERLHWHSLRHTFASWLVQDGVSLFEVQKLLGHSSTEVTQIYSHLQPEQLHSTVNRISLN